MDFPRERDLSKTLHAQIVQFEKNHKALVHRLKTWDFNSEDHMALEDYAKTSLDNGVVVALHFAQYAPEGSSQKMAGLKMLEEIIERIFFASEINDDDARWEKLTTILDFFKDNGKIVKCLSDIIKKCEDDETSNKNAIEKILNRIQNPDDSGPL